MRLGQCGEIAHGVLLVGRYPGGVERDRLVRLVAEHVLAQGVTSLTLRGLARAVGSSHRMLLYYFGSKEQLVGEALRTVGRDLFPSFDAVWSSLERGDGDLRADLQRVWDVIADPANLPFLRLFFEVFGQAVPAGRVLRAAGGHRVLAPAGRRAARGAPECPPRSPSGGRANSSALWRGLQMTLIITGDPVAVNAVQAEALTAFCARTTAQTAPAART